MMNDDRSREELSFDGGVIVVVGEFFQSSKFLNRVLQSNGSNMLNRTVEQNLSDQFQYKN